MQVNLNEVLNVVNFVEEDKAFNSYGAYKKGCVDTCKRLKEVLNKVFVPSHCKFCGAELIDEQETANGECYNCWYEREE